jgi:FkbM family methyltransferase
MNEVFVDRVYDIPGLDLTKCRTILDLGANFGIWSLYAASQAPQAKLYCFEPSLHNFQTLERNLEENHIRAVSYQMALAGTCRTGFLDTGQKSVNHMLASQGEAVECIDLERLFALTGVNTFDFAKIDIEGAEVDILAHCTDDALRRFRAISMEWHRPRAEMDGIVARLRAIGFEADVCFDHGKFIKAQRR